MSNNIKNVNPITIRKIGNYTKNAIEEFEEGIVNEHNYLEKVDSNLKKSNKK